MQYFLEKPARKLATKISIIKYIARKLIFKKLHTKIDI